MTISVVIPTYNRGAAIRATVESALSQDLSSEEVEVIVVNDGSTDDTFSILQSLYGQNPQVRLFSIPNGGVARARNFGLEKARGEFIAFLDHDDLWLPQKLRLQCDLLRANTRAGVVYCGWHEVDEAGCHIDRPSNLSEEERCHLPRGDIYLRLMHHNFIISMSLPLSRTQWLREVGGFDSEVVPCDDWDIWIRMAHKGYFEVVDEVLVLYRRHENQQSIDEEKMLTALRKTMMKNLKLDWTIIFKQPNVVWITCSLPYFYKTRCPHYEVVRQCIAKGDWSGVRIALLRGWLQFPWLLLTPQWIYIVKRLIARDTRPF